VTYLFKKEDCATDVEGWERALSIWIDGSPVGDTDFLLFVNMSATGVEFHLPEGDGGRPWKRIVDTAEWAEPENNFFDPATSDPFTAGERYWVHPFSITVFQGPPA